MHKKIKECIEKETKLDISKEIKELIISDIGKHLKVEEQDKHAETKHLVGMKFVLRGWVAKNKRNANEEQSRKMKWLIKLMQSIA